MPTKSTFAKSIAMCISILALPFMLNGECAPNLEVFQERLILAYPNDGSAPTNLSTIDVDFPELTADGIQVVMAGQNTWQTTGSIHFNGVTLTGTVTIHYSDSTPSIECEYVLGELVGPLPIELSVFNGHLMENDVFLSWATESEKDNAGFEIERSFDGKVFERIAFINGAGNSDEKLWYSFEDIDIKNVALGKAVYYQLKQIDYDQTYWHSQVVVVDLKIGIQGFKITKILGWNNPDRIIKVYFHNPANVRKINISVASINGQLVEQKAIYPIEGFNVIEIDLSKQKENLFFISLNNGKQTTVQKLILHPID